MCNRSYKVIYVKRIATPFRNPMKIIEEILLKTCEPIRWERLTIWETGATATAECRELKPGLWGAGGDPTALDPTPHVPRPLWTQPEGDRLKSGRGPNGWMAPSRDTGGPLFGRIGHSRRLSASPFQMGRPWLLLHPWCSGTHGRRQSLLEQSLAQEM